MSQNIEYVIICIGENDVSLDAGVLLERLRDISRNCPAGVIPIFTTIAPRANALIPSFRSVNGTIRQFGHYIDMEQVFLDCPYAEATDANIRSDLFLPDGVHPNAQGHLEIFRRIQMDCPYLF